MPDEFVTCVNRNFTMDHRVNVKTKMTVCGLKWIGGRPGKRNVWTPNAIWFTSHRECKRCHPKKRKVS